MAVQFDHTRIRVGDLQRSMDFYGKLGFRVSSGPRTSPSGNQIAHLELPGEKHRLELCHSGDYDLNVPEDLVHTCVRVDDIMDYCDKLEKAGIEIWPENWRQKFPEGDAMAFVTDPDNYEVEILPQK